MKAHEYLAQHGDKIFKEAQKGKTDELSYVFSLFSSEIMDIAKQRHVTTKDGLMRVVEEQNLKWNVFARKFREKYSYGIIRKDAIRTAFQGEVESL